MKNTFGTSVTVTLFGESHGEAIGAVVDGLAPGITVDEEFIKAQLTKRRPQGAISTARVEADSFKIVSGVFNGKTTGTPICLIIENTNTKSRDYEKTKCVVRPGHADYSAWCKYHGYQDYRGGGHFSGRITAALVAAGAIVIGALKNKGIYIGSHIKECAGICDRNFDNISEDINKLNDMNFAVLDEKCEEPMKTAALDAAKEGESVGGILETAVWGIPAGVGEPWFDTFESILAHGLFSVPAVKGVQFGSGFDMARMRGSEANDPFAEENGRICTLSNHNGGINGGITNGMPVIFSCAVKPTPSIYKEQKTVDVSTGENTILKIEGRHDPAIVHRARVVVDSITAFAVCDMLAQRYGTDYLGEK